jgi:phage-related minor tail protein
MVHPVSAGEPLRWIYPVVGGIIAEALTIAFIALAVAVTGHGGPGPQGEPIDPVAHRIGAVAGATVGSLFCFVMGWWAARRADSRFEAHGLLTGAAAGFLAALGAVFGPPGQAIYYIVAVLLKLFAGRAGGRMAAKMAAETRGTPP